MTIDPSNPIFSGRCADDSARFQGIAEALAESLDGAGDTKVAANGSDATPGTLDDKLDNPGTYDSGVHQLVYYEIIADSTVRLFTAIGAGGGGGGGDDELVAIESGDTARYLHACWIDRSELPVGFTLCDGTTYSTTGFDDDDTHERVIFETVTDSGVKYERAFVPLPGRVKLSVTGKLGYLENMLNIRPYGDTSEGSYDPEFHQPIQFQYGDAETSCSPDIIAYTDQPPEQTLPSLGCGLVYDGDNITIDPGADCWPTPEFYPGDGIIITQEGDAYTIYIDESYVQNLVECNCPFTYTPSEGGGTITITPPGGGDPIELQKTRINSISGMTFAIDNGELKVTIDYDMVDVYGTAAGAAQFQGSVPLTEQCCP